MAETWLTSQKSFSELKIKGIIRKARIINDDVKIHNQQRKFMHRPTRRRFLITRR